MRLQERTELLQRIDVARWIWNEYLQKLRKKTIPRQISQLRIRDWTRTCWEEKERWIEDPKRQWHPCPRLANRAVLENSGEYLHAVLSDTLYRRKIFESIKMKLVLSNLKKDLLVVLWGNKYAKSIDLEDSCRCECYDFEESFRVIGRKNNKHKGCSFEVPLT